MSPVKILCVNKVGPVNILRVNPGANHFRFSADDSVWKNAFKTEKHAYFTMNALMGKKKMKMGAFDAH
jgi:hypothetical protein